MRKFLVAAAGAALLAGAAGLAVAQDRGGAHPGDANNDGVVTRQEFDAAHAARFTEMDANRDGQLARDEMRRRHAGGGEGHHRRGRGGHGGHGGMMGADANNDGAITREEFLARPIAMFDRFDANNNGIIEASERPQRRQRAEGERRERVRVDADNNGSISQAEFAAQGARMFERMDANNDGRLTQDEAPRHGRHRQPAQ